MKTRAVRLYGKMDMRLEEFELPEIREDEILAEVVADSLCMSSYKAITRGSEHKKVPENISTNPIILGHEFSGVILKVGEKWRDKYTEGDRFVIQPNIGDERGYAPGYSFEYIGGDATKVIIMNKAIENGSLLKYNGDSFFEGSLVEPLSCVVGAFNAQYHTEGLHSYKHIMGIKDKGSMVLMGATGAMGFLAIDYAIHGPKRPSTLVVTGRTQAKLDMAQRLYSIEDAAENGVRLIYLNTSNMDSKKALLELTDKGYDDVFVFAPDKGLVNVGASILAYDGCLNFFAGPADTGFTTEVNFYNVHYNNTHFVGTSGGNTDDMKESIRLIEDKVVDVSKIVTHIMGLDSVIYATERLPELPGAKKIVYTHLEMPLTSLEGLSSGVEEYNNDLYRELSAIVAKNNGIWSAKAEEYLLDKLLQK